eukprot:gene6490-6717_t
MNPFDQGDWDPFGDLQTVSNLQPQELQGKGNAVAKPARAAPPPPVPPFNPFTQSSSSSSGIRQQLQDEGSGVSTQLHASNSPPVAHVSDCVAPPSYNEAVTLPPPPAYEEAASLPPPPSYEQLISSSQGQQQQAPQPPAIVPARAAPPPPRGPLHAGFTPVRQPPAVPGFVPARAAPQPPKAGAVPARAAPAAPAPASQAPQPPQAAVASANAAVGSVSSADLDWLSSAVAQGAAKGAGQAVQQSPSCREQAAQHQLEDLQLNEKLGSNLARKPNSGLSPSYWTSGSVGRAPKHFSSQQAGERQLNAQIRLPPLNAKNAAPLKVLAAGLGSLFAGPVDDAGQLFQWAPSPSGATLPHGAAPAAREDHDSAACAELKPLKSLDIASTAGAAFGSTKGSRVSCMLFGPGPGRLWCGCSDGTIYCWVLTPGGGAARWLHSWVAHNSKVKAMALSPSGRLYTGSGTGSMTMWSYGNQAFADSSPPRKLRQLQKLEGKGVASRPHNKVVGMAVSGSGLVLWSVGKNTISLWSCHNGQYVGTLVDDALSQEHAYEGHAGRLAGSGYAFAGQLGPAMQDINPKHGLESAYLDTLFEQPAAELLAEADAAAEADKDAAAMAYTVAAKGAAKASKLLGKLGKQVAAKLADQGWAAGITGDMEEEVGRGINGSSNALNRAGLPDAGKALPSVYVASWHGGAPSKVASWGNIKKLVAAEDGSMWVSYKKGLLEKYSDGGKLLWSSCSSSSSGDFRPSGITALAAIGSRVWVGDQEGQLWVLDAGRCTLQRSWKAHAFAVRSIADGGPMVYSLGKAGSIRAWGALEPPTAVTTAWQQDRASCLQVEQLQVLAGTWNVNETKPSRSGLQTWLGDRAASAQLIMIGLQEVEMGTLSVGLDALGRRVGFLEGGTQAGQAWVAAVSDVLGTKGDWRRVGMRQMSGTLVLVYARAELEPHIGEVSTASVACGVMGYGGNKGAVAISFTLFRRRVVVLSSHFAAHQDKVEARNADYAKIVRGLQFHNAPTDKAQHQQQQCQAADVAGTGDGWQQQQQQPTSISHFLARQQRNHSTDADGNSPSGSPKRLAGGAPGTGSSNSLHALGCTGAAGDCWSAGVREADLLVWIGDFNYRVDCPDGFMPDATLDPEQWPVNAQLYQHVHQKIAALQHLDLLSGDQLTREMARGNIFHGLAEGPISFLPTYKFEKGRESNALQPFYDQGEKKRVPAWTDRILFRGCGAQRNALQANLQEQPGDVQVSLRTAQSYNSLMEVNDSDHKPVYANPCGAGSCRFVIQSCAAGGALPTWLEVVPAAGVLAPGSSAAVRVQGTKAQWAAGGSRCELRIMACLECSSDSAEWPAASVELSAQATVVL